MSAYAKLFRHALLPSYERLRGQRMLQHLAEYERGQWLDPETIAQLQWQKLEKLLSHCWANIPYYQARWREAGLVDIRDIRNMRDFTALPILTKDAIREHWNDLISPAHRKTLLVKSTSGSTGAPLRLGYDRDSYERRVAVMHRGYGWAGARMGDRTVYLWGTPAFPPSRRQRLKDRAFHAAFNRRMLNVDVLDEAILAHHVDAINRFKPDVIVAFVAAADLLAQHMLERGLEVRPPRAILCAAETLHPQQRERIELAFRAPAYNTYGCREVMLIAAECSNRQGLHVNADHLVAECTPASVNTDTNGRAGEVLLTDLYNYGMPLVRYANGDLATPSDKACSCGRGLPLWEKVDGRILDALQAPNGRFVPGERIVNIFMDLPGVRQFQAVQQGPGRLELRLVQDATFRSESLDVARERLEHAFGDGMEFEFTMHDEIPSGPGGKRRVTMRQVE